MYEEHFYLIWTIILLGIIGVYEISFAIYDRVKEKQMMSLNNSVSGTVTGLLHSHLFKNDTYGEVPGGTIIGWGVAQGEQYWGGTLKMRIPPWFPCVKYVIEDKEYYKLMGEGNTRNAWKIGQEVTVLYEQKNPYKAVIEGDNTYKIKCKIDLIVGMVFLVACVICICVLMI